MKRKFKYILAGAGAAGLIAAGAGIASAATSTTPPPATRGCVGVGRALTNVYENSTSFPGCTTKQGFAVSLSGAGTTGPAGPAGARGPAGPSGVQAVVTAPLTATAGVPTGGSFNSKAVQVGTASLPAAGTYLLNLNAQSEPSADTSSAGVQPQFFVYDQAKNASFTGDLLNIGSGTLAPAGTDHDSYASGTQIVTVTGPTTLYIYGFGYDNDSGASDFNLIAGSLNAVQLTPAP
jgi:hypothetical protein